MRNSIYLKNNLFYPHHISKMLKKVQEKEDSLLKKILK